MLTDNLILNTDSYKVTHAKQYPAGTQTVYSYLESRGGEFHETVFFGLQYILKRYFLKPITQEDIEEAASFYQMHFGNDKLFNREGWEYIVNVHGGKLPISIKAVKEGTVVPVKNVLMTIENTDPKCHWLTNYLETLLLQVWYPISVATLSREMKKVILASLEKTGDPSLIPFKLHDFGF
ncbi:MAG: nicotinamide phosphoribosyltransferase domain-containing protein, partial [Candidatus Doudnabacteria bacterium]|nr:nicotinamide phosphoribosyltransferase domain-containing protein [Candidatus Doudnabacteria bacterium]